MVSKFAKDVNQGKMPGGFIGKLNKKWTVALSEGGELYISGFLLTYKGQKADLTMNYNAGKEHRFPLQIAVENMDLYSVSIYDENGELDYDMRQFEEAPSPGKIDIPDWSSTIEELKRLGKIGLNDDSGLTPKDDSRGFADSFNNGKINNIKVNKNIIENFDQFCLKFLYESVNDDEYLAAVEADDMETAQRMVNEAAEYRGIPSGIVFHISKQPITKFKNEYKTDLSSMGFHFGTEAQANFRGGQYDFSADNPIMNRVFLKLRNPLRVSHMESYAPEWLADKMIADELLDEGEWVDWNEEQYLPTEVERGTYLVDQLKKWKYDGLVYANDKEGAGDSYVPFDPNQIKSADPITRNNSGNIIPLSSRFDSSKDDIRY
jgi:hypothetical protein